MNDRPPYSHSKSELCPIGSKDSMLVRAAINPTTADRNTYTIVVKTIANNVPFGIAVDGSLRSPEIFAPEEFGL